jgi:hypothetical protein
MHRTVSPPISHQTPPALGPPKPCLAHFLHLTVLTFTLQLRVSIQTFILRLYRNYTYNPLVVNPNHIVPIAALMLPHHRQTKKVEEPDTVT